MKVPFTITETMGEPVANPRPAPTPAPTPTPTPLEARLAADANYSAAEKELLLEGLKLARVKVMHRDGFLATAVWVQKHRVAFPDGKFGTQACDHPRCPFCDEPERTATPPTESTTDPAPPPADLSTSAGLTEADIRAAIDEGRAQARRAHVSMRVLSRPIPPT